MEWNGYLHILLFLDFTDNRDEVDGTEENYNRLWKIWDLLQILNRTFSIYYNPPQNLAIDEVVQRKGDFDTILSEETQPFWHQNLQTLQPNRLHESLHGKGQTMQGTTLDSNSCQRNKTDKEIKGCGHKLYTENFLSFLELFNDLIRN
jgi:hypothetical protein